MTDLERRLDAVPHLSSDGLVNYQQAIVRVFGKDTPYTRLVFDEKTVLSGSPDTSEAGTSFVERWNLTCRQQNARYRRKTLAFSKSVEQHLNQVALSILPLQLGPHSRVAQDDSRGCGGPRPSPLVRWLDRRPR